MLAPPPPPSPSDATVCVAPPPIGDDANAGTADAPVATVRRALALGRRTILMAAGEYAGPLSLEGELEIFGGLDPAAAWRRGEAASTITGGNLNRAVTVAPGARVRVDGMAIRATEQAYMAVCVERDAVATFTRCAFRGGDGNSGFATALSSWGELHVVSCRLEGGAGAGATGMSAFGRSSIVDNDIEASHIGVNCYGATLVRNRINAGTYGVYIQGDDVTVRNNLITLAPPERSARGIFIVSGERHVFEANTIIGGPDESRWVGLRPRSWLFDEVSDREYREITITANGLWYHGEADGPSGGGYTGPTQDFDDFLEHGPAQTLPPELRDEIRAYLRAYLGSALALVMMLATSACSRENPHATPETATRAFLAALNRSDVGGMRELVIAPERLGRAISCPPDDKKIDVVEAVAFAHETMHERAGMNVRIISTTELSRRDVAAGDDYRGCRALEAFELRRYRLEVSVDDSGTGERRPKTEQGDVIRLDGKWWMIIPSG